MKLEQSTLVDEIKGSIQNSNHVKKAKAYNIGNIVNMAIKMKTSPNNVNNTQYCMSVMSVKLSLDKYEPNKNE